MIDQCKLIQMTNKFRTLPKVGVVPRILLVGLKRYEKPSAITNETWNGIIKHIDELIDRNDDFDDMDCDEYIERMIDFAIEESKNIH